MWLINQVLICPPMLWPLLATVVVFTKFTEPEPRDKQIDVVLSLERKQLSSENRYI